MALGTFTEKQWEELKKRDIARMAPAERDGFLEEAQVLCAKNEDLLDHNINGIKKCETDVAPISALHTGLGKYADINTGGGLPKETILCKGAKVVLLSNEWKEAGKITLKSLEKNLKIPFLCTGLVNGAMGKVVGIIYAPGNNPPDLPHCVLVKFDSYLGLSLFLI